MTTALDVRALQESIDRLWAESILPSLEGYVRIPCLSPAFDPQWESHGHLETAVQLLADWCRAQPLPDMSVQVRRITGLTPVLLVEVAGELPGSVLLYGHLDKQPALDGWLDGLGPWQPVERGGKLYGRGSADDGYAVFSALAALVALKNCKTPLPRCVVLIEATEESGSIHLGAHLEALGAALGEPSLIVCLDAECGNYEQLWCTSSLRGCVDGLLDVRVLSAAVHSGLGTGIAPAPFRIAMQLLARLEDPATGKLLPGELGVKIPFDRRQQIEAAAKVCGSSLAAKLPFLEGVCAVSAEPAALLVGNTWGATLSVIGAEGLPSSAAAGNVLLPQIRLRLSFRLPPTCDATRAAEVIRDTLERNPPYGAHVRFEIAEALEGWNAPALAPWLETALERASAAVFGSPAIHLGCGGTIPFAGMFGRRFPKAQFFVTGVLGPHSNAHGPNEFLHLDYARRLTCCLALVLTDFQMK